MSATLDQGMTLIKVLPQPWRFAHNSESRAQQHHPYSSDGYGRRHRKKTNTGYSIAIPTNHESFHSSTWVRISSKSCQVHRQEDGGQCPELPLSKELTAFGDEVPK